MQASSVQGSLSMSSRVRELVAAFVVTVSIVTFCLLTLYFAVNNKPYNYPDALLIIVAGVVSAYITTHAATNGAASAGSAAAQSVIAAQALPYAKPSQPAP